MAEIDAAQARALAAELLEAANLLDEISRPGVLSDVYALGYQAGHADGTQSATLG